MSDRTPTLQQMLKALNKLENWFVFGAILGVPVSQLKKIESSYSQGELERCKIDLLQYWIDNELAPTWNEVILALEQTDHLALASQIKFDYLLSASGSEEEGAQELNPLPPSGLPPSSLPSHDPLPTISAPASSGLPLPTSTHSSATDEIAAEIRADVVVVSNLKELEKSFGRMLVQVRCHLENCELSDALLFLDSVIGSGAFIECNSFSKVLRHLQRDQHIDVFNISILQQLVACFDNLELTEVIVDYNEKKESFLKQTTVLNFQRAVVSRVEPILASGKAVVTIKIPEELASCRTLRDIGKLAMEGFEECHKKLICLHAELGSSVISWVLPQELSSRMEQLACDNAAVLEDNGVIEVTVEGRRVFPCTQQEEKSKLKQLYIEFYQRLVEAVSDPDTCHLLTTQLHSTSLLSEKKAALSSSLASGSSFLRVLGVEEEPHILTVLMEKMSAVKQLQKLSEDMSSWLSRSKQGAADTPFTEKQAYYERIERQQLVADIERLTSDKADLLTRLQCYEEDLKTTNELLTMREKAISGMMAAVRRRDTDVEETEERISHLKRELEKLRREGVESGGRESKLIKEVEELKSKLIAKTDEFNEAIKRNSELEETRKRVSSQLSREIEDLKCKLIAKTKELYQTIKMCNSEFPLPTTLEEWKRYVYKSINDVAVQIRQEPTSLEPCDDVFFCDEDAYRGRDVSKDEADQKPDNVPLPTEQLLKKELKEVTDDWKLFGVSLGVPVRKLDTIKLDDPHGGVESWKLKMFQLWLQSKPDASWNDVVRALEENEFFSLAAKLRKTYSTDEIKEEKHLQKKLLLLKDSCTVVHRLQALEESFCQMLHKFECLLDKTSELSEAKAFLYRVCGSDEFEKCTTYRELINNLSDSHIGTFNISTLKALVNVLQTTAENHELNKIIAEYEEEKEEFRKNTTVVQFMQAVVKRVEPILQEGKVHVTIKIPKEIDCCSRDRTLKDIAILAQEGFKNWHKHCVHMHATFGSIIISWIFPKAHSCELEEVIKENASVFNNAGVEEVTICGKLVYSSTQLEKVIPTATSPKEFYTDLYHRLIKAVSQHTWQSLLTQLISIALIMSIKYTCIQASDSMEIYEEEEDSNIPALFSKAGSRKEKLQVLQESMTTVVLIKKVQQQLETVEDIEKLKKTKIDLQAKLQHCEEELKTANELLTYRTRILYQA